MGSAGTLPGGTAQGTGDKAVWLRWRQKAKEQRVVGRRIVRYGALVPAGWFGASVSVVKDTVKLSLTRQTEQQLRSNSPTTKMVSLCF